MRSTPIEVLKQQNAARRRQLLSYVLTKYGTEGRSGMQRLQNGTYLLRLNFDEPCPDPELAVAWATWKRDYPFGLAAFVVNQHSTAQPAIDFYLRSRFDSIRHAMQRRLGDSHPIFNATCALVERRIRALD